MEQVFTLPFQGINGLAEINENRRKKIENLWIHAELWTNRHQESPGIMDPRAFKAMIQALSENSESIAAGILCCIAKSVFDPEKLVVLSKPV